MKYDLLVFDMDGTILDTLEDLKNSMNHTLRLHNMPERTLDEIRSFVGNGIRRLIELAVVPGTSTEKQDAIYRDYMAYYKEHCADDTKPYDGIIDAIRHLRSLGYKTAVVSNKAHPAVLELCDQYFTGLFDLAIGETPEVARKPAPDMVHMALKHFGVPKERAVYIGDSDVDVATARNSELDMIAVDWGFRSRECLIEQGATTIISKPDEILKYV